MSLQQVTVNTSRGGNVSGSHTSKRPGRKEKTFPWTEKSAQATKYVAKSLRRERKPIPVWRKQSEQSNGDVGGGVRLQVELQAMGVANVYNARWKGIENEVEKRGQRSSHRSVACHLSRLRPYLRGQC